MSFTVHLKEVSIDKSSFNWLSNSGKIERWFHVENLLSMQIKQRFRRAPTIDYYMTMAHDNLVEAISLSSTTTSTSFVLEKTLQFLAEQLHLVRTPDNRKWYSNNTQCFAFMTY